MTYIPSTPRVLALLRKRGSSTLRELALELELSVTMVAADLGGLHDRGYVTKYGNEPSSIARWDGPDDDYVLQCVETAGIA